MLESVYISSKDSSSLSCTSNNVIDHVKIIGSGVTYLGEKGFAVIFEHKNQLD